MNNEKAIEKLIKHKDEVCHGCVHPQMMGWCEEHCMLPEALNMAIEALKQVTGKLNNPDDSLLTADAEACKEQKSKLDLISRQMAIKTLTDREHDILAFIEKEDMEYEEAHSYWCEISGIHNSVEILESLPSAETPTVSEKHQLSEETPTNTPTDLINRQDAIDAFNDVLDSDFPYISEETPRERIESIPSAEPKVKCIAQIKVDTKEVVRRIKKEYDIIVKCKDCLMSKERDEYTGKVWCCRHREYMDDMYYCADGLRKERSEK